MDITNINRDAYVQTERADNSARVNAQTSTLSQGTAAPVGDRVSVSEEGALRTEAYRTAMNTSDVRQNRVNELRDMVANGTYEINPHRIASNMINEEAALLS